MTEPVFTTLDPRPQDPTLDAWLNEIEVRAGAFMPAHELKAILATAPESVRTTQEYAYWQGILAAHGVHFHLGGVAA